MIKGVSKQAQNRWTDADGKVQKTSLDNLGLVGPPFVATSQLWNSGSLECDRDRDNRMHFFITGANSATLSSPALALAGSALARPGAEKRCR